jgi:hypothetical protein
MQNSTYTPKRFEDLNADCCMVNDQGCQATIPAGTTGNMDLKLIDDHLLTGVQISAHGSAFGDSINLQVIDKDLIIESAYGHAIAVVKYPNYPVLRQFSTNWKINSDTQMKLDKEKLYPAKVIAGLYLRATYTSTGSTDVDLIANYELHILTV